jgi:hypothetical protein
VLGGEGGEPAAGGHDLRVTGLFHPQLDDVHAADERTGEELVGLVAAHQIEVRGSNTFTAVGHGSASVAGVPIPPR